MRVATRGATSVERGGVREREERKGEGREGGKGRRGSWVGPNVMGVWEEMEARRADEGTATILSGDVVGNNPAAARGRRDRRTLPN